MSNQITKLIINADQLRLGFKANFAIKAEELRPASFEGITKTNDRGQALFRLPLTPLGLNEANRPDREASEVASITVAVPGNYAEDTLYVAKGPVELSYWEKNGRVAVSVSLTELVKVNSAPAA